MAFIEQNFKSTIKDAVMLYYTCKQAFFYMIRLSTNATHNIGL